MDITYDYVKRENAIYLLGPDVPTKVHPIHRIYYGYICRRDGRWVYNPPMSTCWVLDEHDFLSERRVTRMVGKRRLRLLEREIFEARL